jgi:hypothetical protein
VNGSVAFVRDAAILSLAMVLVSSSVRAAPQELVVALMPLAAEGDVGAKELAGVDALVRAAVDEGAYVRLLPTRKDDAATSRTCRSDDACLRDAARARGVDFVASITLTGTDSGYLASVRVVSVDAAVDTREETLELDGALLARDADRLGRLAFKPDTLRGRLQVSGHPEGALVLVDGERIGKLPLATPIDNVLEGERKVEFRAKGYETIIRTVKVLHGETTDVNIVMSKARADLESPISAAENEPSVFSTLLGAMPWVLLAGGVAFLVAGVASGVVAYMDQAEVERRAEAELLVFPRDALLVRRGLALAITANVFYALSLVTLAGAGGVGGAIFLMNAGDEE